MKTCGMGRGSGAIAGVLIALALAAPAAAQCMLTSPIQLVPLIYDNPNNLDQIVDALYLWYQFGTKEICIDFMQDPNSTAYPALVAAMAAHDPPFTMHVIPGTATYLPWFIWDPNDPNLQCGLTRQDRWLLLSQRMQTLEALTGESMHTPAPRHLLDFEACYFDEYYGCDWYSANYFWVNCYGTWYPPQCPIGDPNDPNDPNEPNAILSWMSALRQAASVVPAIEMWVYPGVYPFTGEWHNDYNSRVSWAVCRSIHNSRIISLIPKPDCLVTDLSFGYRGDLNSAGAWNMRHSVARVYDPNISDNPYLIDPNNANMNTYKAAPITWCSYPFNQWGAWWWRDIPGLMDVVAHTPGQHRYMLLDIVSYNPDPVTTSATIIAGFSQHCKGDMDCDGYVGFSDMARFAEALNGIGAWTHDDCSWLNADMNCDGNVDGTDLTMFVARLGTSCN